MKVTDWPLTAGSGLTVIVPPVIACAGVASRRAAVAARTVMQALVGMARMLPPRARAQPGQAAAGSNP